MDRIAREEEQVAAAEADQVPPEETQPPAAAPPSEPAPDFDPRRGTTLSNPQWNEPGPGLQEPAQVAQERAQAAELARLAQELRQPAAQDQEQLYIMSGLPDTARARAEVQQLKKQRAIAQRCSEATASASAVLTTAARAVLRKQRPSTDPGAAPDVDPRGGAALDSPQRGERLESGRPSRGEARGFDPKRALRSALGVSDAVARGGRPEERGDDGDAES